LFLTCGKVLVGVAGLDATVQKVQILDDHRVTIAAVDAVLEVLKDDPEIVLRDFQRIHIVSSTVI